MWAALRLIPAGRIILLTVALMPMVIHQAASLTWDSIAFGIGFLYCAIVIPMCHGRPYSRPHRKLR